MSTDNLISNSSIDLRSYYEALPNNIQSDVRSVYYKVASAETKLISELIDAGIVPTLKRSELKSRPDITYLAYGDREQHRFTVPPVPNKHDIIEQAIYTRADFRPNIINIHSIKKPEYTVECSEPFVAELPHVTIFGPHAIARSANGELPLELKAGIRNSFDSMLRSNLRWFGRCNTLKMFIQPDSSEQTFSVASSIRTGRNNTTPAYGHWLVEILPRIRGIKYYEEQSGRQVKILVNPNITDWQKKTLNLIGVDTNNLVKWHGGKASVDRYVLPKWSKSEWCVSDINWIRKKIEQTVDFEKHIDRFSPRIYLSRENMDRRRLINREEVMNELSAYGFQQYAPETMSFSEQVALFKNAEVIVGPAGGSFTNIIFSDQSHILELFQPNQFTTFQFELAQLLNHQYFPIFGDSIDTQSSRNPYHCDFTVSPDKIISMIENIS